MEVSVGNVNINLNVISYMCFCFDIGIFGTQESIHHSVPMVFCPIYSDQVPYYSYIYVPYYSYIYSDQFRNAMRSKHAGIADILNFHDISVSSVYEKLNTVLNDKRYADQVNLVSQQFRDHLVDPMQESMYWIEFIARHKENYPIFKPNAPHVPYYSYIYLDIILFFICVLYTTFIITKYALKRVWQRFDTDQNLKQKVN